jgi:hypothetical protein
MAELIITVLAIFVGFGIAAMLLARFFASRGNK